jgi:hypothetical protein
MAMDKMCIGMYGSRHQMSNSNTTVCSHDQIFFLVQNQTDWDWGAKTSNNFYVDAVCGLGKEKAEPGAQGWIAKAVQSGVIKHNTYSVTLVPQKLSLPPKEPTVPAERTHEQIMKTSFLTLGGWDESDYVGDIRWMSAGDGWNQTLTELKFEGLTIVDEYDYVPV